MTNFTNIKRAQRIRNKLESVNFDRFRLTVFRSTKNMSAQIVDDKNNKTLVSATSLGKKKNQKKSDISSFVAESLVKKALEKKITKVYFDRGNYRYHGRIKKFADALRKGGLTF